jgi:hippurate hydrolase
MPDLPVGTFAIRPGPLLAASDFFEVMVQGKGGHGAMPAAAKDTTLATAAIVMALQQIVAREVPTFGAAVVSVTGIQTDTMAHNVIPGSAKLTGTARFFDKSIQEAVIHRINEVVTGTAAVYGCSAVLDYQFGVGITENNLGCTEHAIRAANSVAGAHQVQTDIEPLMGGEDFSEMLDARPGAFIFIGNGNSATLHHPEYNFNDEVIPNGCSWFAELAEQRMPM